MPFLAGTGRVDITPAPGTPQGTWGAQTHERGIGSDLPQCATALVLSSGAATVAIIDVDATSLSVELASKIIAVTADTAGIPPENVRVSYSHTHSGANIARLAVVREGVEMGLHYIESLPTRIAGAAWQARRNLRPARIAAGTGTCAMAVNRRLKLPGGKVIVGKNQDGPVDHTVRVVRIDGLDENPLAVLVHYSCHPITVGWQNQYFTPDYPGVVRRVVERNLGGTCLFLQGAAGDIMPRKATTGDLRVYRRWGGLLGLEAARVALGLDTLPRRERYTGFQPSGAPIALYAEEAIEPPAPALRVVSRPIRLPLRKLDPPGPAETEARRLREELDRLRASGGTEEQVRAATVRATQGVMLAQKLRALDGRTHMECRIHGVRVGRIALIGLPVEPLIEIGQAVVAASPFEYTLFSGYTNGMIGYLPVRSAFEEGGYEVETSSAFTPDAADIAVRESLAALRQLAD